MGRFPFRVRETLHRKVTIVRAHSHVAGVCCRKKGTSETQAFDRLRGGLSTKVIAVAWNEDGVLALDVLKGDFAEGVYLVLARLIVSFIHVGKLAQSVNAS